MLSSIARGQARTTVTVSEEWYSFKRTVLNFVGMLVLRIGTWKMFHKDKGVRQCRGKGKWAPPEISRGAPHTLLAYYYELQ